MNCDYCNEEVGFVFANGGCSSCKDYAPKVKKRRASPRALSTIPYDEMDRKQRWAFNNAELVKARQHTYYLRRKGKNNETRDIV